MVALAATGCLVRNVMRMNIKGNTALCINPPDEGVCGPAALGIVSELAGKLEMFNCYNCDNTNLDPTQITRTRKIFRNRTGRQTDSRVGTSSS